jgi:hypothetical protein
MTQDLSTRRYEVMAQRDGRWVIDCLTPTEGSATARADALLLSDDRVEAVRVLRARFSVSGDSWETPIYERAREARLRRPPIAAAATPDEATWCETIEDFYGPDGRRAVARVLRHFLDRYTITPTELLHDPRYLKPLEGEEGLIQAAVGRIAQQQAAARGVAVAARRDEIYRFIDAATRRAKAARAAKALPAVGAGGLAGLVAAAAKSSSAAERDFVVRFAASRALGDAGSFLGRLEIVIGWAGAPTVAGYVDELISGLLGAAGLIQDVIGPRADFGQAILCIADLVRGRQDGAVPGASPLLPALAQLMAQEAMTETRLVLLERLQREIAGDKPLSHGVPAKQRQLFDQLLERLIDDTGLFLGGPGMIEALARRTHRLGLVGGIEAVRYASADPAERLNQLLDLERETLAERPARALATRMAGILERFAGDPEPLQPIRRRLEACALPDDAKAAVLGRLPHST